MAGLGKGFDSLMPVEFDQSLLLDSKDRIQRISIDTIYPNPDQPRKQFDDTAIRELSASLKRYGVLQPLIVSSDDAGRYRIIAGERRWRAAQLAQLTHVPVIVRERQELEELEISLIENVQRVDLSALEQAISIERLHQQFNLSYKDIATRLSKAETTVSNIVRLLQLPEHARNALQQQKITEGHARAILALKSQPDAQQELLDSIVRHSWSVRQAEQFVASHREPKVGASTVAVRHSTETPQTQRIAQRFSVPVRIKRTAKGGKLEIGFVSDDELQRILDVLDAS